MSAAVTFSPPVHHWVRTVLLYVPFPAAVFWVSPFGTALGFAWAPAISCAVFLFYPFELFEPDCNFLSFRKCSHKPEVLWPLALLAGSLLAVQLCFAPVVSQFAVLYLQQPQQTQQSSCSHCWLLSWLYFLLTSGGMWKVQYDGLCIEEMWGGCMSSLLSYKYINTAVLDKWMSETKHSLLPWLSAHFFSVLFKLLLCCLMLLFVGSFAWQK